MKRSSDDLHNEHPSKRPLSVSAGNGHLPVSPNMSTGSPSPPRKKEVKVAVNEVDKSGSLSMLSADHETCG